MSNVTATPPEVPGFTLIRRIGSGAYGEVWLGRDTTLGVHRAIKIVWLTHGSDQGEEAAQARRHRAERVLRGLQEYLQRVSALRFPAIAVLELKIDPAGRFFHYTMPLADDARTGRELDPRGLAIDGYEPMTLSALCAAQTAGHLPADAVVRIGARLASALAELHAANVVHQDIKPSNIIFLRGEPIFADVDLVRDFDATRTIAGTPGYVAPEGTGTPAADQYALGKTLFVLATGSSPNERSLTPPGDWDRRPDVGLLRELMQVWARACEDNPQDRHPNAAAMRDELRLLEAGRSVGQIRRLERFRRRSLRVAFIALPIAVLAGTAAFFKREVRIQALEFYRATMERAANQLARGGLEAARKSLADKRTERHGRGPEWQYLWQQTEGDPAVTISLPANIEHLAFSPNGDRLALQMGDYTLRIVATNSGGEPTVTQDFNALAGWIDDEHILGTAKGSNATPVAIWNLATPGTPRRILHNTNLIAPLQGPGDQFVFIHSERRGEFALGSTKAGSAIDWVPWGKPSPDDNLKRPLVSRDGTLILQAVESGDGDSFTVRHLIYELANRRLVRTDTYPSMSHKATALSPDGQWLAFAESTTGSLVVRSTQSAGISNAVAFPLVNALAFSPDSSRLAAAGDDGRVWVLDSRTLATVTARIGHRAPVRTVGWHPSGLQVASGSDDQTLRIWSLDETTPTGPHQPSLRAGLKAGGIPVRIVPDGEGRRIAVSDQSRSIAILETSSLRTLQRIDTGHTPVAFTRDGLWMLSNASNALAHFHFKDGSTELYPVEGGEGDVMATAAPDGGSVLVFDRSNRVLATKLPPPARLQFANQHAGKYISDAAISDDGRLGAIGGDFAITIWDMTTGTPTGTLATTAEVYGVAWRPESHECLVAGASTEVTVIDADRHQAMRQMETPFDACLGIAVIPGEDRFVTCNAYGQLGFGRISDGRSLVTIGHSGLIRRPGEHRLRQLQYDPHTRDLFAMTDAGVLVRWQRPASNASR